MMLRSDERVDEILKNFDKLPDSAVVPTAVAAAHDHVSEWTVRRRYPLIRLSEGRYGVRVSYLRNRNTFEIVGAAANRVVDKLSRGQS
jgi:hypothetical protein